jgi:effector-binding domain-containing protein
LHDACIVDICEVTDEEPNDAAVTTKVVPGCKALVAKHVGPYDTIYMAYQAISKYAEQNGLTRTGPNREVFEKGPSQEENPANFVTCVVVPFAELRITRY